MVDHDATPAAARAPDGRALPRALARASEATWTTEPIDDEYGGTTSPLTLSVARRSLELAWVGTACTLGGDRAAQARAALLARGALGWADRVMWFDVDAWARLADAVRAGAPGWPVATWTGTAGDVPDSPAQRARDHGLLARALRQPVEGARARVRERLAARGLPPVASGVALEDAGVDELAAHWQVALAELDRGGRDVLVDLAAARALDRVIEQVAATGSEAPEWHAEQLVADLVATRRAAAAGHGPREDGGDHWTALDRLKLEAPPLVPATSPGATDAAPANEVWRPDRPETDQAATPPSGTGPRAARDPARAVEVAATLVLAREVQRDSRADVHAALRAIAAHLGLAWQRAGVLADARDVFDLERDEVTALAAGSLAPDEARRRVAARSATAPIGSSSAAPGVASTRPAPAGLRGWPASPGVASGAPLVARDHADAVSTGRPVLVCERASPGWAPLLADCAAMVSERGSALSHVAIVARELGVPYVSGVAGACDLLAGAARVEVDGSTGLVRVLD